MTDYTELCARLRAFTTTGGRLNFSDTEEAADALESQAREIAELRTWRDEAVRLCAKRNCAGRDRRIRDLEEDNDALRARAEAAETKVEVLSKVTDCILNIPTMTDAQLEELKRNCMAAIPEGGDDAKD